jgi:hypothetical protein
MDTEHAPENASIVDTKAALLTTQSRLLAKFIGQNA